jgi:hypothetical protein
MLMLDLFSSSRSGEETAIVGSLGREVDLVVEELVACAAMSSLVANVPTARDV